MCKSEASRGSVAGRVRQAGRQAGRQAKKKKRNVQIVTVFVLQPADSKSIPIMALWSFQCGKTGR